MNTRAALVASVLATLLVSCGGGEAAPVATGPGAVVEGSASRLTSAIKAGKGKPVVVNYWATWCEPCKEEMPRLTAAARKYVSRVRFIGANVEDDRTAAQAFARRYGIPFRSFSVTKAEVQRSQNILGLPVTQFFRADGELAFVHQGEISGDDLEEKIEELLSVGRPAASP